MAAGGVPIGSAKSIELATPTATNRAMGLIPAEGAAATTSAPTMLTMAMLDTTDPTMTVKAIVINTKNICEEPEADSEEMVCANNSPSPIFLSAMAFPSDSAAAIKLMVP